MVIYVGTIEAQHRLAVFAPGKVRYILDVAAATWPTPTGAMNCIAPVRVAALYLSSVH